MRSRSLIRLLPLLLLALGGAREAAAQACLSTQGSNEYCKALTPAVRFGFPRYATAALPTCNTNNKGAVAYDTTTDTVKYCTGSAWSAVGSTFTGGTITSPILAPAANNCSSVPYSFTGDATSGMCSSSFGIIDLYSGGGAAARFSANGLFATGTNGVQVNSTGVFSFSSGTAGAAAADLFLYRDAANTLALRNSTNAQKFIWNYSYTDGSNYQQGALKTSASGIEIAAETAGSGADDLGITLTPAGTGAVNIPATYGYPALKLLNGSNVRVYGGLETAVDRGYLTVIDASAATTEMHVGSFQGSKTKTLTDAAAAAAFVRIAVPQTVGSNYAGGDVVWTAFAADATPHTQSLSGRLTFTAINNAGTEVCAVDPTAAVTAPNANSSGTLQCTFSCASNAADTIDLMATCDTSLGTPTALSLLYRLDMPQPNTVTPQ